MTAARRLDTTRALLDTPEPTPLPGQLAIPAAALAVMTAAEQDAEERGETIPARVARIARDLRAAGWTITAA